MSFSIPFTVLPETSIGAVHNNITRMKYYYILNHFNLIYCNPYNQSKSQQNKNNTAQKSKMTKRDHTHKISVYSNLDLYVL